jgi:hypothetical protein
MRDWKRNPRWAAQARVRMRWRPRAAALAVAALLLQAWLPLLLDSLPRAEPAGLLAATHGDHEEIGPRRMAGDVAEPTKPDHQHDVECPLCVIAQIPAALPPGAAALRTAPAGSRLGSARLRRSAPRPRSRFLTPRPRAPPLPTRTR